VSSNPSWRDFSRRTSKTHDEKENFKLAVYSIWSGDDIFILSLQSLRMPRRYRRRKKRGGEIRTKKARKTVVLLTVRPKYQGKKISEWVLLSIYHEDDIFQEAW